jgi:sugar-phosphatase
VHGDRGEPILSNARLLFCTTALLLDLDGTLVDSSRGVQQSWRSITREWGLSFEAVAEFIHGVPAREAVDQAYPELPSAVRADLAEQVQAAQAAPTTAVTWMPGARDFVGRIPVDRWAVVTSGDRRLANANMAKAGVPTPLVLVTADDVAQGKPLPDPFVLAARALRVPEPSMCVAVEDSPAGIESAKAAGMRVLAVATTADAVRLSAANWVVPNLLAVRVASIPDGLIVELVLPPD